MGVRFWSSSFVLTLGLAGVAMPARAQTGADGATAQALYDQAKALMAEGRAEEACPKFEESQRLDPGSGTLINLARCYEVTGRLASAWSKYLEAAAAAQRVGNTKRETAARGFAKALVPKLSKLVIEVDSATDGLQVTRGGERVGEPQWGIAIPTDEGEHRIEASAPGYETWSTTVTVRAGKTETIRIPALTPAPEETTEAVGAPPPAVDPIVDAPPTDSGLGTQRALAIVAGGVGVVGLGIGAGFGFKSISEHDRADKFCDGKACTDQRGVQAANSAQSAGTISTVGFVIGAVGLSAGLTLWLTAPSRGGSTEVGVGPGSIQLRRSW